MEVSNLKGLKKALRRFKIKLVESAGGDFQIKAGKIPETENSIYITRIPAEKGGWKCVIGISLKRTKIKKTIDVECFGYSVISGSGLKIILTKLSNNAAGTRQA